MSDSSDVKRRNLAVIRRLLRTGDPYTKQRIASATGLSVATCNTFLNELAASGEVIGEKTSSHGAGRGAVVYRINEEHETILCVYFELIRGVASIRCTALSPSGSVRENAVLAYDNLEERDILQAVRTWIVKYPNTSQIVVGTPSIAAGGVIRHCDIPQLDGMPLVADLERAYGVPVMLANDMHYKVFGYYRHLGEPDEIVTLVNLPSGVRPGTATVYRGQVLAGKDQFAGMVGFLDYGDEYDAMSPSAWNARDTARPLIISAVTALIAALNPHRMAFTGDLVEHDDLEWIRCGCERFIPSEYMPSLAFIEDTDRYYLAGMYGMAIAREEDNSIV